MSDTTTQADPRPRAARGGSGRPVPPRRKGTSDLTTAVLATIAIALPLMFYLRQHVEILRYGYEIEALKERRAELDERARELSVQRAAAASLPEIGRRAEEMGLKAPAAHDVFVATGDDTASTPPGVAVTARLE